MPETLSQSEFADLFQTAWRPLWGIAAAVTGDRVLAEDVLQEAAVIALGKLDAFRPGTSFPAWMGQIVRNVARNTARARRRGPAPVAEVPETAHRSNGQMRPPDPAISRNGVLREGQEAFDDDVEAALGRLGETARACLLLRIVLDVPYREIATLLDIPEGDGHEPHAPGATGDATSPGPDRNLPTRYGPVKEHTDKLRRMLDAYLDGDLEGADLEAFRVALAEDESLRREVAAHERIEASLRRRFVPPPDEEAAAAALIARARVEAASGTAEVAPATAGVVSRTRAATPARWLALAAGFVLLLTGGWLAWTALRPAGEPYGRWRSLEKVYHDAVAAGFTPEWVCADDEEFMGTFRDHFGRPLLLGPLPPEHSALGLAYCNSITNRTVTLLARVREDPVMVFIDRADADEGRRWPDPYDRNLHLHRREIGDLVLYELTPRQQPALLERFFVPEPE